MDVKLVSSLEISYNSRTITKNKEQTEQVAVKMDTSKSEPTAKAVQVDTYEPESTPKKVTYAKPEFKPDLATIQKLTQENDQALVKLKLVVSELLKQQGMKFEDVQIGDIGNVKVDEATQKKAQAAIDDGGEYSAENVSDRIVQFAKAISGGDKSKIGVLRAAIDKGFEEAKQAIGQELPEISQQTYKLVMDKLDAWANEDQTTDQTVTIQITDQTTDQTLTDQTVEA
jgi:hypothetical protein